MRVIILALFSLLVAGGTSANDAALTQKMERLRRLQERVSQQCLNNPNARNVQVRIDGRNYRCPELITVTNLLRDQLAEEIEKHKEDCEQENRRPPHAALAAQAATIAQRSASCAPSPDRLQCPGKFACGLLSAVTFPVATLAARLSESPTVRQCTDQARGMPACLANLVRGIFDSMWSMITLVWDLGRAAVTGTGEWLGLIRRSEATTSERAMMAQQASPGFLQRLASNPAETIKKLAKDLYEAVEESARNHYGCEQWSGTPFVSNCLKPMSNWNCGTCQQKTQVFCGIAGYAIGEIGTAFLTGGVVSGAKLALTGAVKLGAVPSRTVAVFMARTFPRSSAEVAEAAGRVRTLAANGFTAAQNRLFDAWNAIANSSVTRAIGNAARTSGVSTVSRATLRPVAVYLSALDRAFGAGMAAVDNTAAAARGAAGARIADEAMGVTPPGLTVETALAQRNARPSTSAAQTQTPAHTTPPTPATAVARENGDAAAQTTRPNATRAAEESDYAADIARYRGDPEYAVLFRGPQMYDGHHQQLSMVIKAMEEVQPRMTKEAIRRRIQETLNSCQL
jgi:hypothetical protein